jgi:hypothetical protein
MKVRYRGGPMNRKIAQMPDGDQILVSAPDEEMMLGIMTGKITDPGGPVNKKGKYSRVVDQNKDGSYYFVWMGWDD